MAWLNLWKQNAGNGRILPAALLACAFAGMLLFVLVVQNAADLDLWGVMSVGALLDQNPGYFPYQDVFAYTSHLKGDASWVYHEWGSGVLFYFVLKMFGSPGLLFLKWIVLLATLALVGRAIWEERRALADDGQRRALTLSAKLAGAFWLIVLLAGYCGTIRCHIFSFFFFTLFLERLLAQDRNDHAPGFWRLALFPLAMIAWANLHGGFIMGAALLAAFCIKALFQRQWQKACGWGGALAACALSALVNPYGIQLPLALTRAWTMPRADILEWRPIFEQDTTYWIIYSALGLVIAGLAIHSGFLSLGRREWRAVPVLEVMLLILLMKGALHFKLGAFFLLAAPMCVWRLRLPQWFRRKASKKPAVQPAFRVRLAFSSAILTLVIVLLGWQNTVTHQGKSLYTRVGTPTDAAKDSLSYPQGATRFLVKNRIRGNMSVPFGWGQYLYWHLFPHIRVSMDGRYETVYADAQMADQLATYQSPYDPTPAFRSGATLIMSPFWAAPLTEKLSKTPGWVRIYADEVATLYQRAEDVKPYVAAPSSNEVTLLDAHVGDLGRFRLRERP